MWKSVRRFPIQIGRFVFDRFGFRTPTTKRQISTLLGAIGLLFLSIHFTQGEFGAEWFVPVGAGLIVLAWILEIVAGDQEQRESSAKDMIEWSREAQEFRLAIMPVWDRLKGLAYPMFAEAIGIEVTFADLVKNAGWPDCKGETADTLETYLTECMPPLGYETAIPRLQYGMFLKFALGPNQELISDWRMAKNILEIWSLALNVGGSREPALRHVIHDLEANHVDSIRLLWFLSIAHTAWRPFADDPNYSFVSGIRDVMEDSARRTRRTSKLDTRFMSA